MNKKVHLDLKLSWDATFEIALALKREHPTNDLENSSLGDIFKWTVALPNFIDEPELANDEILAAIYQDWFEELNPL